MNTTINHEQRLYVMKSGRGYSCLGFDVAERELQGVKKWLQANGVTPPTSGARPGTVAHLAEYELTMKAGAELHARTGKKCDAELKPALIGLEHQRVEVTLPDGSKNRFTVGKSTGWLPIHLEIKRRDSKGGGAVYLPDGATVRVLK